jgi:squalene synthase HpnC
MIASAHTGSDFLEQTLGEEILSRQWTLQSAYSYCRQLTRSHYENFPVGSLLVPRRLRKHVYAIYAFARTADDFADEDRMPGEARGGALERWEAMLDQSFSGTSHHPIFIALSSTAREIDLPVSLFKDLIAAFKQDLTVLRYETFDQLLGYCKLSANPVGRLILMLSGLRSKQLFMWSDSICTALQLANHWQDLSLDLDKDRIYIPQEDLARFNITEDDLKRREVTAPFRELMRMEVTRARRLFIEGKPLCISVKGRMGLELRAVWLGGWRILDRIESNGFDVFTRRPVITSSDKLRIIFSAAAKAGFRER